MDIVLVFGTLILLMVLGVPIGFSMGLAALAGYLMSGLGPLSATFAHTMYTGASGFILLAIPFYILAGNLMNTGGMSRRIFRFAENLVGHVPGGLGHVNVLASILFAGMSGSAVADAGGLGTIEIKAMTDAGFDRRFSAAVTAASSTIGPIIPPSIPLVVFGGLTSVSVGRLFLGGVVPGLLMGAVLMAAVFVLSVRRGYPRSPRVPLVEKLRSAGDALLAFGTVIIILGGILSGVFTPTEASVVACVYAFVVGFAVYRDLKISDLPRILWDTVQQSAKVLFILATAAMYGNVLTFMNVPERVLSAVGGLAGNPVILLLIINGILLMLGCFMEALSIMLLTVPILLPLVARIGMDPVHFGVMITLNLMIGLITPPVGLCLYAVAGVAKLTVNEVVSEIWPYLLALVAALGLVTFIPHLTLWLPRLVLG